jgi:hypothetical protein
MTKTTNINSGSRERQQENIFTQRDEYNHPVKYLDGKCAKEIVSKIKVKGQQTS